MDIFQYCLCDDICTLIDDDIFLEICRCVYGLFYRSLDDCITTCQGELIDIEFDTLDLKWREESVIDPLSKRVFIDGLSEIVVRIYIVISLRSGGETEMDSTGKIFQYFSPIPILSRTSAVTLIDDDEIEKIWIIAIVVGFEDLLWILLTCTSDKSLIDSKKYIGPIRRRSRC